MSVQFTRPPDRVMSSALYTTFYNQGIQTMMPQQAAQFAYEAARRSLVPSVKPIVYATIFFGFFGIIPAATRANRASNYGAKQSPYWTAWIVTMACMLVAYSIIATLIAQG